MAGLGAAVPAAADPNDPSLPALQVVLLVDESRSLSDTDVVDEVAAARGIALSVLAPGSTVAVVGFGSSNAAGQSPVDPVCPPTPVDRRDTLATCIGGLHRRLPSEGDDTDHVAALRQALSYYTDDDKRGKIVFLLTDGRLDVPNSESYGRALSPEARTEAAAGQVPGVLDDLDRIGVQVWPLGFGDVNTDALNGFAIGKSCTSGVPNPTARVLPDPRQLARAVNEAFSSASCTGLGPEVQGSSPGTLDVDIPAIASDAAIIVSKRDPRVQVSYVDPAGNRIEPGTGPDGSRFEVAGQGTATESLRIVDPTPGTWHVNLTSAPSVPPQDVSATVVFQGAINATLVANPPAPSAGQAVEVDMQVRARKKAISDAASLSPLSFVVTMTGSSGVPRQDVTLSDPERDGTYSGRLDVPPGASGDLTFTGRVTGIGIGGDERVVNTRIQNGPAALQASFQFSVDGATVVPGGTADGTVMISNDTGSPARLRLVVADPSPGTDLAVDPSEVVAPPGATTVPFTLRFGAASGDGGSQATLRLVDAGNPDSVVAQRLVAVEVAPPPPIPPWLWPIIAAVALLLLAGVVAFLVRRRVRRRAREVRGLKAQLFEGDKLLHELEPANPRADAFSVVLHTDYVGAQLREAGPGEPGAIRVERRRGGIATTPGGPQGPMLAPGERRPVPGSGLALAVVDDVLVPGPDPAPFPTPFPDTPRQPDGPKPAPDPFARSYGDPFAGSSNGQGTGGGGNTAYAPPPEDYVDPNNPFR